LHKFNFKILKYFTNLIQMNDIIEQAKEIFPKIRDYRRTIHQKPELSFQEYETCKFIQAKLTELGIESKVIANTGVVALIGKGERCVGLRADIDALPIEEETGLEFSSQNSGVMHACGHDMHTSMLLGAAEILKKQEHSLNGVVKLMFQPGEEKLPGGAGIMIKEGVLENPKVNAVFGQHIFPEENVGVVSMKEGPVMGSADELYWEITGKSAHAAQPHLGSDPILAASQLVVYYQTLMTKYRDPLTAGVLTVAAFNGGTATNIIPDKVFLKGTMRAYNLNWREQMHELLMTRSQMITEAYGCQCDLKIIKGYPPVINHKSTTEIAEKTAIKLFGSVKEFTPKMWGEDFAFYSQVVPATFWFVGVKPENMEIMPALHNSKINPVEEAMINGMAMLAQTAIEYLNS